MNWFKHYLIASITIVVCLGESPAAGSTAKDISRVDSTYKSGLAYLESGKYENAERCFQAALEINSKHAPSYVGLGHVYLNRGNLKEAEKTFREALRKRKNYAPALNGLGLVFRETDKMLDWAIKYFRSAYQADRRFIEAYINLAQVYRTIGDTKELDTYEKLTKVDPGHSDAWFQIGRIYTYGEAGRYRNVKKAEAAYRRQLEANPQHFGARTHLGQILKESGRTDEAMELLKPVVAVANAFQRRALLEMAEVHQTARDHDLADAPLDAYVASLEPKERAVYYDLSLVAIGDELTRFREAAEEERNALSEAFWAGRDPAPATAANERWIEHCRRVAYAREHFGEHQFPWDARGEVYVRYGTPEHISTSENIRFETAPKVLAVKERLMNQAGEALQHLLLSRRMVSFYREMDGFTEKGMDDQETLSTILGYPVYPVRGVWQYWIYTRVGGGVEVTFVQERTPGPYKYAEMPHAGHWFGSTRSQGEILALQC
ncbi:MAG: tetratricopeptide repeat protein [Gemmatimonadota bacterium]|nr:tetratricopeptide repeat protein [Gemmatimonadota bacterium]